MAESGFFEDPVRGREAGEHHLELNRRLEALYAGWERLSGWN